VIKNFDVQIDDTNHLVVVNPPTVKAPKIEAKPKILLPDED
jgi:hypothetical protein